ncbi:MAG: TRAP transporter substrate-binding protein DctP, partial [Proteobacteria bacterium]|nr:TRAP transporter substrate-binding protein DctP [Pseudomonadota bacterium]
MSPTRKRLMITLCILGLFLVLGTARDADAARAYRWKFATQAPKGMGFANNVRDILLPGMDQATEGDLAWKVYYGGVMGNDDDYVAKMAIGQLQGGGLTLVGTNLISPEYSILALPFLFRDFDEVDFIRDVMFDNFDFFFRQRGFKLLLWIDQDFDLFYSTKWRLDSLEDWNRAKILSWSGPIEEAWMKALGAHPIPLGIVEAPSAIRTGVADTNITTGIWQVGTQVYTTTKYVNLAQIRYTPAAAAVTQKAWEDIPEKYRKNIDNIRPELQDKFNAGTRNDIQACLKGLIHYGVEPVENSPEFNAEIKKRVLSVWPQFTGRLWPQALLNELESHLKWYRTGGKEKMERDGLVPRRGRIIEETVVEAPVERRVAAITPEPAPAPTPPVPAAKPEPAPAPAPPVPAAKP